MRIALYSLLMSTVLACGGGSSTPMGDDDVPADSSTNPTPDTSTTPTAGIGTTCTPDQANPQGDCPAGFVCLNLQGATNAWCSKTCTAGAGDTCATGYTGPGKAACLLQVTPQGGGAAETFCGVVCEDLTGSNQICPAGVCDGTCPGTLACTGALTDNNMNTVGNACE